MRWKSFLIGILIIALDQLSKILIKSDYLIIKNFFYITNTKNYGGAWSIFNDKVGFLIIVGIFVFTLLLIYQNKIKNNFRNIVSFGLLYGGIIGNLIDRVFLGYVRDFLDFKIFGYDYPVFNIADMAIVIGAILLGIAIIKGEDKNGVKS